MRGDLHAPERQILHRWVSDEVSKAVRQDCARGSRRRSDADLAWQGIRRADLPRVAFHMLTGACEVNDATAHRTVRGVPRRVGNLCARGTSWGVIANCLA